MKKFILLLFFLFLLSTLSFAEDSQSFNFYGEDYGDTTNRLRPTNTQEYNKAIETYKNKSKKPKKEKKKDIKIPTTPYENQDYDKNPEIDLLNSVINHSADIMIPTHCVTLNGDDIDAGYYQLTYKEKDGKYFLILKQGDTIYAQLPTRPYKSAEEETTINYGRAIGHQDKIELIYGNIDIGLTSILYISD